MTDDKYIVFARGEFLLLHAADRCMAVLDELDHPNGLDIRDELVKALAELTRSRRAFEADHFWESREQRKAAEQDGGESQTKRSFFKHRNKDGCDD